LTNGLIGSEKVKSNQPLSGLSASLAQLYTIVIEKKPVHNWR